MKISLLLLTSISFGLERCTRSCSTNQPKPRSCTKKSRVKNLIMIPNSYIAGEISDGQFFTVVSSVPEVLDFSSKSSYPYKSWASSPSPPSESNKEQMVFVRILTDTNDLGWIRTITGDPHYKESCVFFKVTRNETLTVTP
jgi:hypothetical protein